MSPSTVLKIERVSKNFGGLQVLRDINFSVDQGEIVGLIGPNGAGKSTLFEIIGGGLAPAAGRVHLFGQDMTTAPPHRRRRAGLCRTFQKIRLFASLSVADNVRVAASETTADLSRLDADVARACAGTCRILLLDESLSGLTHDEAQDLIGVIRRLNQIRGITIVLVEHVMPVVMALAERLVVLHYGSLIARGTPQEVVNDPVVIEAYLGQKAHP